MWHEFQDWLQLRTTIRKWGHVLFDAIIPRHPDDVWLESVMPIPYQSLASAAPIPAPGVFALYSYDDPTVRALVTGLKYRKQKAYAKVMGTAIADWLLRQIPDSAISTVAILAVPASRAGIRERGYDQGELIAHAAASQLNGRVSYIQNGLIRTKKSAGQTRTKSRAERIASIRGALAASFPSLSRQTLVVVVDDVRTTGATLDEARRALRHAGIQNVIGVAFAQTPLGFK